MSVKQCLHFACISVSLLAASTAARPADTVKVRTLLAEMVDFENLAMKPVPFFKEAMASSYSRVSLKGGEAAFDNNDVGQYVRAEMERGRTEQVLADLKGPGTITRFWSANPDKENIARFYFDGESSPRIELPLAELFTGRGKPFGPEFSYISGTGGNLYYPIPYALSLKVTVEEKDKPLRLYYEIGYRTYVPGTAVETFDPGSSGSWEDVQVRVARLLSRPESTPSPKGSEWVSRSLTIPPGETVRLPAVEGEKAVYEWSARVRGMRESTVWNDPLRAHNAYRFLVLAVAFDGERSIETPLGDFFGSGPGVNPYENLLFSVSENGWMTSRLLMPFKRSMELGLTNSGRVSYTVDVSLRIGPHVFTDRGYYLRALWGALTRESWPHFDTTILTTKGEGKVVGTVYEIANPVLIWWGEGDQKISIDGEGSPSTWGTGTEDDYGFAYGYNERFTRPFHAQTRVDGPWSGGHISLNRWYVLDALPFRSSIRFDQEMWHWMPCRPTWGHVVYWYAAPGTPGPPAVKRESLAPVDLGIRENMLEPYEGEALKFTTTGGTAKTERLANCSGAEHLVWRGGRTGDRLAVHFDVPKAGKYSIVLNLCMSPDYGRQKLSVNGVVTDTVTDCYSPELYWLHPKLGVFDLKEGDNTLEAEALEPDPAARPGNLFGLDYIFLIRQ